MHDHLEPDLPASAATVGAPAPWAKTADGALAAERKCSRMSTTNLWPMPTAVLADNGVGDGVAPFPCP